MKTIFRKYFLPIAITLMGMAIEPIYPDRSSAQRSPSSTFKSFTYRNEFKVSYPSKWTVDPTGLNSNCHIYPTDSTVCTFAYMYSYQPRIGKAATLPKSFVKTDIVIEFEPNNNRKGNRADRIKVGGRVAYRYIGKTDGEGDFEAETLTTSISYKNRLITLNSYFTDRRDLATLKKVHDSFLILR